MIYNCVRSLEQKIERLKIESDQCELDNYDKLQYSNPYSREIERLKTVIAFIKSGVSVEDYRSGLVLINGYYVVSLLGRKWRVKGKNKWYWFKNPEHLVNNYIVKKGGQKTIRAHTGTVIPDNGPYINQLKERCTK